MLFLFVFPALTVLVSALFEDTGTVGLTLGLDLVDKLCIHDKSRALDVSKLKIYMYDFFNDYSEYYPLHNTVNGILSFPRLDRNRKFVFFIGGYLSGVKADTADFMKDGFKSQPHAYLVIIDHTAYTGPEGGYLASYKRSVRYTYHVGVAIGIVLSKLNEAGIPPNQMHIIGHSLGAHMAGHAAVTFIRNTGKRIARITASDPAGPCFKNRPIEDQIRKGVAEYVDVYHCSAGTLGSQLLSGDADFIINGGRSQPNCRKPGLLGLAETVSCNHKRCIHLIAASVKFPNFLKTVNGATCGYWNEGLRGVFNVRT